MATAVCTHVAEHLKNVKPKTKGCESAQNGDSWSPADVPGVWHVGCCDSSKNRHARAHFHSTQHPLIQSAERARTGGGVTSTRCICRGRCGGSSIFGAQKNFAGGAAPRKGPEDSARLESDFAESDPKGRFWPKSGYFPAAVFTTKITGSLVSIC